MRTDAPIIANLTRSKGPYQRQFQQLLIDMETEQGDIIYYN